jgi:hypothetical protein
LEESDEFIRTPGNQGYPGNVQRIEAGEINLLITTAKRIKTALGCSWDDLMEK